MISILHDGGNRWDHRIASVMTADAVTAALAHTNRPVRLVGATTGATAQISLQAHSTGQPQEWTALSPIVEDALPRLRQHTRHCGAKVLLSMAGAETSLWFRLPRPDPLPGTTDVAAEAVWSGRRLRRSRRGVRRAAASMPTRRCRTSSRSRRRPDGDLPVGRRATPRSAPAGRRTGAAPPGAGSDPPWGRSPAGCSGWPDAPPGRAARGSGDHGRPTRSWSGSPP